MATQPKVLLVDDEPYVTDALRAAFRKQPFEVLVAGSAMQAIATLERESIDVLISDEMMPGMQGSDLLVHARRVSPGTARIILTGQASMESALRAINQGQAFRFLLKPFPPGELAEVIHQALAARAQGAKPKPTAEATAIAELEGDFPGLTQVERGADGGIEVGEEAGDLPEMLGAISGDLARSGG